MCWSVSGCRVTFFGLPSLITVTGSSGSRYSWSALSRSRTSTNGSRRLVMSGSGPRVEHVGAVDGAGGAPLRHGKERVLGGVQKVEQPPVRVRQLELHAAGECRDALQHQLHIGRLGGGEARRIRGRGAPAP